MSDKQPQRIFVTGASRGIGAAIARKLSGDGTEVTLHGRDKAALDKTAGQVEANGGQPRIIIADLSSDSGIESVLEALGDVQLDTFVNNAGVAVVKPIEEISKSDWDQSFTVNVTAPFRIARHVAANMTSGASIVNIMSIAARNGFPGWGAYCMSKFALEGISQSMREELRPEGIRVINVYPSATSTELWDTVEGDFPREKMLDPNEVAETVAFAVSRPGSVLVENVAVGNIAGTL